MKPLFSSKASFNANIKLKLKDKIIQIGEKAAETLNSFFENAVSSLKLNEDSFVNNNEHKNFRIQLKRLL